MIVHQDTPENKPRLPLLKYRLIRLIIAWIKPNIRYFRTTRQPILLIMGLLVGISVGIAAIIFREMIGLVQLLWLQDRSEFVATAARNISPWIIIAAPTLGGLAVGTLLHLYQPSRRTFGVADVIEARVLTSKSLPFWPGLHSALLTILSLGSGASSGREGPVVHLGATLAALFSDRLSLPPRAYRTLLACGAASAVSASFNAPIAGVLFAHEVILGHYAASALVPIVIASVAGTLMARFYFGEHIAFSIPDYTITSYLEFPAFALLGIVCAIVAIGFQASLAGGDWISRHITMPLWLRPAVGGALIGMIGLYFPEVLGVGYEATDMAIKGSLPFTMLMMLLIAKILATTITLSSRFGGGIFSPALYLGAMTGGAFGIVSNSIFPHLASSEGLYAILGMGAVAASVIGAPISTILIVFELTGGYTLTIALMLVVSLAHGITQAIHGRSFFHWQLERRGLFIQDGPHKYLVKHARVSEIMRPAEEIEEVLSFDLASGTPYLKPSDSLETALRSFDTSGENILVVVDAKDPTKIAGEVYHVDALRQFNSALIKTSEEEHR